MQCLVKRKADRMFFDNRGGRYRYRRDDWKENPSHCQPFINERAARQVLSPWIDNSKCTCPNEGQPSWRGKCTKTCFRIVERHRLFDARYEIVPIRIEFNL